MKKVPLLHAAILLVIWVAITMGDNLLHPLQMPTSIVETITHGLSYPILLAGLSLLVYVFFKKIIKDVGLTKPVLENAWIIAYPLLAITLIGANLVFNRSFTEFENYKWLLLNTFLVGLSEELMFRGILFSSLKDHIKFSWTVIIVSVLFGSVHVLNFFITGKLGPSFLQAFFATMSGFLFIAIRVRTKSILPCILIHALFDFVVTLTEITAGPGTPNLFNQIALIVMICSPIIYGVTGIVQLVKSNASQRISTIGQKE